MSEIACLARTLVSSARRRTADCTNHALAAMSLLAVVFATMLALPSPVFASPAGHGSAPNVVDYSSGFTLSTPATLKKAGVGVVIRYVGSSAWKSLTPGEAAALRLDGIDIASVYESSAGWMLAGRSAGIEAARTARAAIIADGGPNQPFVYFACDTDTSDFADVNAALLGAQSVLGPGNVGIYGSYSVCANALRAGAAAKAWQTVSWSNGQVLPGAVLLQLVPQTLGDLGVDYDTDIRNAADIGQWGVPASETVVATDVISFTPQSTPSTATLRAIESSDGVSAWAVGDRGTILHTSSAGATWTAQSAATTATLHAVNFADNNNGWVAGENGRVFHTIDGGRTWNEQSTPTTATLRSIYFTDDWGGWAVGERGTVLHTGDGGATWIPQSVPTTATLNSVEFSSETTGVAVGENGAFVFTGNGGKSWFEASTPTTSDLSAQCVASSTVAWSVGASGTVLHTGNDGATWTPQSLPTTSALTDVEFSGLSRGMAVGASGTVLFTANAGQTWTRQSLETTGALNGVELAGTSGWVVGDAGRVFRLTMPSVH
ncbi:MAG: YCF48-related protein [Coriobacteriia bacterium]|nr:YCF48-related protein [Coriobacteriia bacterium]